MIYKSVVTVTGIVPRTVPQDLLRNVFPEMDMSNEEEEFTHLIGYIITRQLHVELNKNLQDKLYFEGEE